MNKITTEMAEIIKKRYKIHGFTSAFIYGIQGSGKTTYALLTLYALYQDWDLVKQHFFMDDQELEKYMWQLFDDRERVPALVLDDAGISLSKYEWRKKKNINFGKLFNLARTVCGGIIFTSVGALDIIKFVRDKVEYRLPAKLLNEEGTKAEIKAYQLYITPLLEARVNGPQWTEVFWTYLPPDIREWAEELKREITKKLRDEGVKVPSEDELLREEEEPDEEDLLVEEALASVEE